MHVGLTYLRKYCLSECHTFSMGLRSVDRKKEEKQTDPFTHTNKETKVIIFHELRNKNIRGNLK